MDELTSAVRELTAAIRIVRSDGDGQDDGQSWADRAISAYRGALNARLVSRRRLIDSLTESANPQLRSLGVACSNAWASYQDAELQKQRSIIMILATALGVDADAE